MTGTRRARPILTLGSTRVRIRSLTLDRHTPSDSATWSGLNSNRSMIILPLPSGVSAPSWSIWSSVRSSRGREGRCPPGRARSRTAAKQVDVEPYAVALGHRSALDKELSQEPCRNPSLDDQKLPRSACFASLPVASLSG
jgi:hypothetical protein